jgi:hypothetical protein
MLAIVEFVPSGYDRKQGIFSEPERFSITAHSNISPKSGGKKILLPFGRSVFLRLKRWSAFVKMQCPLFYQTRCVFFKGCLSSLLLFLDGLLFFPRRPKKRSKRRPPCYSGFYFNCTIGSVFQREKPLKR